MFDVLLIGLVIAFFLLAESFVRGCTRIVARGSGDKADRRP